MRSVAEAVAGRRALRPLAADIALAAVVTALTLAQFARSPAGYRPPDAVGAVLLVLICAALPFRGVRPRTALAAMAALTVPYVALGYTQALLGIPLLIAVYTVGSRHGARASAAVLALVALVLAVAYVADPLGPGPLDLLLTAASMAGAWWVGASVRIRREQLELVQERAALVERARRDDAARAVARERLRIARELHDVVAHSLSVVAVQAGMAEHVLAAQPERAAAALAAIADSSRAALGELRRLLGVLRSDDEPEGSLAPALGIADLQALVERVRDAGLGVALTITGNRDTVPAAVGLTAYRIVQEALTNVVRHAGTGAAAGVTVGCGPVAVDVEVVDDGRGTAAKGPPGAGTGLIGIRERVEVFGGALAAGPEAGGAWRVTARLPISSSGEPA